MKEQFLEAIEAFGEYFDKKVYTSIYLSINSKLTRKSTIRIKELNITLCSGRAIIHDERSRT